MTTINITPAEIFQKEQVLTVAKVESLKGKTIACTSSEYKGNHIHVTVFVVGEIISEWDDAISRAYPVQKSGKQYNNFQEYWKSYMSAEQIDERKTNLILCAQDGSRHFVAHTKYWNFYKEPTFTGSDADREVYYIELDATKD